MESARAELLRSVDPEEFAKVNDSYAGWNGKRLQVEKADREEAERQAYLRGLRDKAAQGDSAAAVEYAQAQASGEIAAEHQRAWSDARKLHDTILGNDLTKDLVADLARARHASMAPRDAQGNANYGQLAQNDGWIASLLYRSDLVDSIVAKLPDWEKKIREDERAKIEPTVRRATEREVRAKLLSDEPSPDIDIGGVRGGSDLPRTLAETRALLARMPASEYARRESEIDRHLASFTQRRRAS